MKGKKRLNSNKIYEEDTSINHINYISHTNNSIVGENNQIVGSVGNNTRYSSSNSTYKNDKKPASIAVKIIKYVIVPIVVSVLAGLILYYFVEI